MSTQLATPTLPLSPLADWYKQVFPTQRSLNVAANVYSKHDKEYIFRDTDGTPVLQCGGKIDGDRDGRKFMDPEGKEIFTFIREHLKVHTTFNGEIQHGHDFEVKSEGIFGGHVTFKNVADGRDVQLKMKGNWKDREAHIVDAGDIVARISPDLSARKKIFGKSNKSYVLTIAPQVDVSLIAAFCIALDEIEDADGIHATHAGILS